MADDGGFATKMEIRLARLDAQPVGARPASLIPGRDQRRFLELFKKDLKPRLRNFG
jgi:hypothetical protein